MNDQRVRKPVVTGIDFPSNSHRRVQPKAEAEAPRKIQQVATGMVTQRKKSIGKRFMETFISEDVGDVKRYLFHDVLIPAMKNTLIEIFSGGSEMMFSGQRRSNNMRRSGGQSHVSYQNYSNNGRLDNRRERSDQNRTRHDFGDIVLTNRGEAEAVLSCLVDLTIDYQQATVSDLYQLVGIQSNYTDDKWGWFELSRASVSRARDGYVLNLPRPVLLD